MKNRTPEEILDSISEKDYLYLSYMYPYSKIHGGSLKKFATTMGSAISMSKENDKDKIKERRTAKLLGINQGDRTQQGRTRMKHALLISSDNERSMIQYHYIPKNSESIWTIGSMITRANTKILQESIKRFENKALIEAAKNIKEKYNESEIQKTLLYIKSSNLGSTTKDVNAKHIGAYVDHIISLSKDIEIGEKPDTFDIKSTFNVDNNTVVSERDDFAILTLGLTQSRYKEMQLNMLLHDIYPMNLKLDLLDSNNELVYGLTVDALSGSSNTFLLASPSIVQKILSKKCE